MSVDSYQRTVNSLDKELADLEQRRARKEKEIADLEDKINRVQKSINKNTSQSMLNSKLRTISSYESDKAKKAKDVADLSKRISEKKKKRNDAYIRLQKEQQNEQSKQVKQLQETQRIQAIYESTIQHLQNQIVKTMPRTNSAASSSCEEYDVFISHAYEDKEDFVDDFAAELKKQGLKVWYDTDRLQWGDSMREKIDKGLAKSRYGIVILTPNYIAENKYWTKAELNGLFQKETINGKTILPIWHKLTKKDVTEYSPIIADRKAMTTALMTAEEIAVEFKKMLSLNQAEDNQN